MSLIVLPSRSPVRDHADRCAVYQNPRGGWSLALRTASGYAVGRIGNFATREDACRAARRSGLQIDLPAATLNPESCE